MILMADGLGQVGSGIAFGHLTGPGRDGAERHQRAADRADRFLKHFALR
ncbi:hypothetical protein HNR46_003728 [Haloferula luteola]|uniref:Uncharacterized protein n=1 Tax=Haloferula luteola TaxID=595692 RepID=A0A840V5E8_9BACT|nr:hypothetical protein [Haloferula luteola]